MYKGGKSVKKALPILLSFMFFLSGCTMPRFNRDKEPTKEETMMDKKTEEQMIKEKMDGKMTDPELLQSDNLLMVGDYGVEKTDPNFKVQEPPSDYDLKMAEKLGMAGKNGPTKVHHNSSNAQLHAVFVNPNVKPMWGNYAENVVQRAWKYYGTPYEFGSKRSKPNSFDCSDFTRWIYLYALGMDLPKTSSTQWAYVKQFSKHKYYDLSQAKRGDLLFFMNYKGWQPHDYAGINVKSQPVGHCGIYLGNGKMLHTASAKTGGVRVDNIKGTHLEYRFIGGGTVLN